MTTAEVIRKLVPKRVIERAEQVAAESDARARPSIGGRRLTSSQAIDLTALVSQFHSEDRCRAYLERVRWLSGVRCPRCDAHKGISQIEKRRQFDCNSCGYQLSVRAGTIFHDSHLPLWKWFLAVYAMGASNTGLSANQLERMLGISYKTAWYLRHRIRAAMRDETPELLRGIVQAGREVSLLPVS